MTNPRQQSLEELAAGAIDDVDEQLLRHAGRMFDTLDPVPSGLVDRITFGLTLDALHAEIAELQRSADLVGVRAEANAETQTITFTSATLTTMITVTPTSGDRVRIDGWIDPGDGLSVELRSRAEVRHTVADQDGRFVFDDVPHGLAQFVLRAGAEPGERPVVTPAIEI